MSVSSYLPGTGRRARVCAALLIAVCALVFAAVLPGQALAAQGGGALSARQRLVLHGIAASSTPPTSTPARTRRWTTSAPAPSAVPTPRRRTSACTYGRSSLLTIWA
jgi:hypothetical protein